MSQLVPFGRYSHISGSYPPSVRLEKIQRFLTILDTINFCPRPILNLTKKISKKKDVEELYNFRNNNGMSNDCYRFLKQINLVVEGPTFSARHILRSFSNLNDWNDELASDLKKFLGSNLKFKTIELTKDGIDLKELLGLNFGMDFNIAFFNQLFRNLQPDFFQKVIQDKEILHRGRAGTLMESINKLIRSKESGAAHRLTETSFIKTLLDDLNILQQDQNIDIHQLGNYFFYYCKQIINHHVGPPIHWEDLYNELKDSFHYETEVSALDIERLVNTLLLLPENRNLYAWDFSERRRLPFLGDPMKEILTLEQPLVINRPITLPKILNFLLIS